MPTTVISMALGEILGASFRVTPSLDLDLAFGTVDSNVDLACTHLLSSPSPPPSLLSSAPSSTAAGETFWDSGVFFPNRLSKIWILRNEIPRLSVWNLLAQVRVNVKNNKYKEVDGIVRSHIFFSWKNPWFCRLVNTSHRTSLHHLNLCSNQIIRGCLITVQCLLIQVTHVYHCSRHEVVLYTILW